MRLHLITSGVLVRGGQDPDHPGKAMETEKTDIYMPRSEAAEETQPADSVTLDI